jgi:DNA-binding NtrC family response regulator
MTKTTTILCIDDDAQVRSALAEVLAYHEYNVVVAACAEDALRLSSRQEICLMVLDINLSGENGLALMPYLRLNCPDVPVVLYTGLEHDEQQIAEFFDQGASGYVRKAEPINELLEVIRIALASRLPEPQKQPAIGLGRRVQRLRQLKQQGRKL